MTTATPTEKPCSKCGEVKPLADYHRAPKGLYGRRGDCKACTLARTKAWRDANKDRVAAYRQMYYEANKERITAHQKAYYEANRERYIANDRAYQAERWATDPEYRARRKANLTRRRRMLASAKQEPYTRESIFERDGWTCGLCGEPIDRNLLGKVHPDAPSIDHIVPLSRGGDDTPANVQAAHFGCNSGKCDRVEHEDAGVAA